MNAHTNQMPVVYLDKLMDLCEREWKCKNEVLRKAGFGMQTSFSSMSQLDYSRYERLILSAFKASNEPALGLKLAETLKITDHQMPGVCCLACPDVKRLFSLVMKYSPILCPLLEWDEISEASKTTFRLSVLTQDRQLNLFITDVFVVVLEQLLSFLLRQDLSDLHIIVGCAEPSYSTLYNEMMSLPISFSGAKGEGLVTDIVVPHSMLDRKLPLSNRFLLNDAEEKCEFLLNEVLDQKDIIKRTLSLALKTKPQNLTTDFIADKLNISSRTLRRKLKAQGTSFSKIVDEVKKKTAIHQIQNTQQSLKSIAFNLGYTDYRSFLRAFQKWTDRTPGSYR